MNIRLVALSTIALTMAGCSNSNGFTAPSGLMNASIEPARAALTAPIDIHNELLSKKTRGGRMLAAIALERVTGRKPDPARLSDLE